MSIDSPSRRHGSNSMMERISKTAIVASSNHDIDQSADTLFLHNNPESSHVYGEEYNYADQKTPLTINTQTSDVISNEPEEAAKLPLSAAGMLVVYTIINLLSYFDRGALSGCLDDIVVSFPSTTNVGRGLLGSAFMGGFMIASPIAAHLVTKFEPFRVMAIGLLIWTLATSTCFIAPNYFILFLGRVFTGFGEASFLCIAPPFIDKFAPTNSRGLWLSVFYTAIPVGYALGFITSGVWLNIKPFDENSWRYIFLAEALLMVPFVLFSLNGKSPYSFTGHIGPTDPVVEQETMESETLYQNVDATDDYILHTDNAKSVPKDGFVHSLQVVLKNPVYIAIVLGYSMQTFVTGGFAFFGMDYAKNYLGLSDASAGVYFGLVTVFTGIVGTLSGGIISDRLRRSQAIPSACGYDGEEEFVATEAVNIATENQWSSAKATEEITKLLEHHKNDLTHPSNIRDRVESLGVFIKVVVTMTVLALPFACLAFVFKSSVSFFLCLTIAELLLFCCFSPLNGSIMSSVPFRFAPQAMALSVVVVHAFGDTPSPLLIGLFLDITDNDYRLVMFCTSLVLFLAILSWVFGRIIINKLLKLVSGYSYSSIFTEPDYSSWTGSAPTSTNPTKPRVLPQEFNEARDILRWSHDDQHSS